MKVLSILNVVLCAVLVAGVCFLAVRMERTTARIEMLDTAYKDSTRTLSSEISTTFTRMGKLEVQARSLPEQIEAIRKEIAALKSHLEKVKGLSLHAGADEDDLNELLERAERVAREVSPYEAARLLAKLSQEYPFSEAGMRAGARLREWHVKPQDVTEENAPKIDSSVRASFAENGQRWQKLEKARHLASIGKYIEAIKGLRRLMEEHPNTKQGGEAREILSRWGAEDIEIEGFKDETLEDVIGDAVKAQRLLDKGWHYRHNDRFEKAKEIFRTVIDKFPHTIQADHAENALAEIEKEEQEEEKD